ncbi:hypothetical protein GKC56_01775 [Neisseriaceae bacterium PsAf]|nr:hypothetical protein [Neisseriaceae bacterium PsAf]MCV2502540.1 hypothetical protein [Neisseriaceae bacterium]
MSESKNNKKKSCWDKYNRDDENEKLKRGTLFIFIFGSVLLGIGLFAIGMHYFGSSFDKLITPVTTIVIAIPAAYITYMRQKNLEYQNQHASRQLDNQKQVEYQQKYIEATKLLGQYDNVLHQFSGINMLVSLADNWHILMNDSVEQNKDYSFAQSQRQQCMQLLVDYLAMQNPSIKTSTQENKSQDNIDRQNDIRVRQYILTALADKKDYLDFMSNSPSVEAKEPKKRNK